MSDREVRRIVWWEWAQRAAAILFIPLLTLFIWQNWKGDTGEVAEMMEVKTSPGMTTSLTLPDGTIVYLNSESSLSYPSRFNGDFRKVTLSGEAYFEVAKDPEKKFILSTTHQSQIEVLGTCFNVEAYEQNTEVITTLIEGKVDFMFEKDAGVKHVFLSPREKLWCMIRRLIKSTFIKLRENQNWLGKMEKLFLIIHLWKKHYGCWKKDIV